MNDLELAAEVLSFLVLEHITRSLKFTHVGSFCDNTSAAQWAYKLRTNKSIPAAHLLQMLGI